jgi:protein-tyrosine phosphatase
MREVIPGIVWIGTARDARNVQLVLNAGIAAVIDLAAEEPVIGFPRDIVYCRYPLLDGSGNSHGVLRAAVLTVASLLEQQTPMLIACSGGMSRSPAVVAAALAIIKNCSLDEALERIAAIGPHDVAPAFLAEVWSVVKSPS